MSEAARPQRDMLSQRDLLYAHLNIKASGERLQRRVDELKGTARRQGISSTRSAGQVKSVEVLEDFGLYDTAHLFWEEVKQVGFALLTEHRL